MIRHNSLWPSCSLIDEAVFIHFRCMIDHDVTLVHTAQLPHIGFIIGMPGCHTTGCNQNGSLMKFVRNLFVFQLFDIHRRHCAAKTVVYNRILERADPLGKCAKYSHRSDWTLRFLSQLLGILSSSAAILVRDKLDTSVNWTNCSILEFSNSVRLSFRRNQMLWTMNLPFIYTN